MAKRAGEGAMAGARRARWCRKAGEGRRLVAFSLERASLPEVATRQVAGFPA